MARRPAAKADPYTEEQRTAFVEVAARHGVYRAMRQMGYPKSPTAAYEWCSKYGVEPAKNALAMHAGTVREWYADSERRLVLQLILDSAHLQLTVGEPVVDEETGQYRARALDAKGLASVSSAVQRAVNGLQLLDGKATTILEQQGPETAPEIVAMIEEYRQRNEAAVRHLRAVDDAG